MKRLALFVMVAVAVAAAYEVNKTSGDGATSDNAPPTDENALSEVLSAAGDTSPAPDPVSASVGVIFQSVKDTAVTLSRAAFGTPFDALITSSANAYWIPPEVLYKLLYTESRFRPDIIEGRTKSPTGALGIAQFMPATAIEELGSVAAALDPQKAIPGAARYLAKLRASLGGDLTKAVAAYNWGIGNVKRKGLAAAPKETVNYAFNILGVKINA